jgi:hypothetical protein
MSRFFAPWPLLAGIYLTACAPATPDTAPAGNAPAAAQTQRAASTTCPAGQAEGSVTSKGRHVPNEDDPCADSRGAVAH